MVQDAEINSSSHLTALAEITNNLIAFWNPPSCASPRLSPKFNLIRERAQVSHPTPHPKIPRSPTSLPAHKTRAPFVVARLGNVQQSGTTTAQPAWSHTVPIPPALVGLGPSSALSSHASPHCLSHLVLGPDFPPAPDTSPPHLQDIWGCKTQDEGLQMAPSRG